MILERNFGDRTQGDVTASVLDEGPIQWLDGIGFSASSLDAIYCRVIEAFAILRKSPK